MKHTSLIIGGNRGIGKSIYETLKKRGDTLYTITRSSKNSKYSLNTDITNKNDLKKLKNFFKKVKINNLIFAQRYRGNNNNLEYDVMVKATNEIIKIAKFKKQNSSIIILGSIASQTIIHDQDEIYHYTRGALETLTKYYACTLGVKKTRVNCVLPTKIFKPENKKFFSKKNNIDRKLLEKITPLKRMGDSKDVANLVDFLTSNKSSYLTGLILPVDGGLRLLGQEQIAKKFIK